MAKKVSFSSLPNANVENQKTSLDGSKKVSWSSLPDAPTETRIADIPTFQPEPIFEPKVDTGWFDGISDDEETVVQNMVKSGQWTPEEGNYARQVMKGETETQKTIKENAWTDFFIEEGKLKSGLSALTGIKFDKIIAPFTAHKLYYFDPNNKGLPKPVSPGDQIPKNVKVESLFGNDLSAGDDYAITTFVKGVYNTLAKDVLTIIPNLKAGLEGLITGERTDDVKNAEYIDKLGDAISFEVGPEGRKSLLTEHFKDLSDLFNSKSYDFNSHNIAKLAGNVVGSLLEFGAVGRGISAGSKGLSTAARIGKETGAGALVSFNETFRDAMLNAPQVNPRSAAAMAFTNAIAYGFIERLGGVNELNFLNGMKKAGAFNDVSRAIKGVLAQTGGEINEEFFKKAFSTAIKTNVSVLPRIAKTLKVTGGEALEETAQTFWTKSSESLYDTLSQVPVDKQYGTEIVSPESLKEYFESAIGGAIGGLVGGIRESGAKKNAQQTLIFDMIKKGKKLELKKSLLDLTGKGKYSTDQLQQTSALIDAYDDFYTQIKDKNLPDDQAMELLKNAFHARYLNEKVKEAEADETKDPIIKKAEVDALNKQKADYEKKITSILYQNEKQKEKEETEVETTEEEDVAIQEKLDAQQQFEEDVMIGETFYQEPDEEGMGLGSEEEKKVSKPASFKIKAKDTELEEEKKEKERISKEGEAEFRKELEENFEEKEKEYYELTKGRRIFNTDTARRLYKKYTESPETMVGATQLPAREFVTKLFNKEIDKPAPEGRENAVLFTSGGSGVGKSTVVSKDKSKHQAIVDTNLADFEGAVKDIDNVLSKGKRVDIAFVYRDLYNSFVDGVMKRAKEEGLDFRRTIPADIVADIHERSLGAIKKLSEHYKDNPSVKFYYFDNSQEGKDAKRIYLNDVNKLTVETEEALKKINKEIRRQYEKGEISKEAYEGFKSTTQVDTRRKEETGEPGRTDSEDGRGKSEEGKKEVKEKTFEEAIEENFKEEPFEKYSYAYYNEKAQAHALKMSGSKERETPALTLSKMIQHDLTTGTITPEQAEDVLDQWREMKVYQGQPNLSSAVEQIIMDRIARAKRELEKKSKSKDQELIDKLEKLKIKGKDAKSIIPPFNMAPVIWNGALSTIQAGIRAKIAAEAIIKKLIQYFKKNDPKWWNKLSKEEKTKVVQQFNEGYLDVVENQIRIAIEGETKEERQAAKEFVASQLEISEEEVEGVIEEYKSIRFEQDQFEGNEKKLRKTYTDSTGKANLPSEGIAKKFLFDLIQSTPSLEGNGLKEKLKSLAENETDEKNKNLLNFLASHTEDTIRSTIQHFRSSRISEYLYFSNRGGKWKSFISNKAVEDKEFTIELKEQYQDFVESKGKGYQSFVQEAYDQYLKDRDKIWSILSNEITVSGYKKVADEYATLSEIKNPTEEQSKSLIVITKKLNEIGEEVLHKRKSDSSAITINRLINEYSKREAIFLSSITSIDQAYWDQFQEQNAMNSGYLNASDSIVRNLKKYTKPGLSIGQWIIKPSTENYGKDINANKVITALTEGTGKGSQFQSLSRIVTASQKDIGSLDTFNNVDGKLKNSYLYVSPVMRDIEAINTSEVQNSKRLISNPFIQFFKNHSPKKFFVDGMKNMVTSESATGDNMTEEDISVIQMIGFLNGHVHSGKGTYLQPIEKFSDKAQELLIETPKYSLDEAKDKFSEIPNNEKPTFDEISKEIEFWKNRISDFIERGILESTTNQQKTAEEYVYNYAVNKHYMDLYFQGNVSNYTKKGNDDYITRVKRQNLSNGIVGDTEVDGGIGKVHYNMTMNDPKAVIVIGKHVFGGNDGKGVEIPDGFQIAFQEWGEKMNKSYGSIFDVKAILKTFYSKVNQNGSRLLLKGNTVVIPDSFAYEKNKDGSYKRPILAKLRDYSKENHNYNGQKVKISVFSFESSSKIRPKSGENKVEWFGYTNVMKLPETPNIMEIDNQYYLYQQDLNQDVHLKKGSLTKQLLRFAMDFKNGIQIQKHFNRAISLASAELKEELQQMDDSTKRQFFLRHIKESSSNYVLLNMLKNEKITLDSPLLSAYLDRVMGSIIEKRVLDVSANKGLLVETPAFEELQEMKKLDDTIQSAGVIVPRSYQKQGFKIGDKIFITRVPSTYHHSTSLVEIQEFSPDEMGSIIIINPQIQKISGSDNDGDTRHVWAPFKDKEGNVIELTDKNKDDFRAVMNEAWKLMQQEYTDPKNFNKLVNPIDTSKVEKDIQNYKEKTENINKNLPSSYLKVYESNMEAKRIIAIIARFMAVHSFGKAHFFKLKDSFRFPQLSDDNSFTAKSVRKLYSEDQSTQEEIDITIANNGNQATDNAKEQNLNPMGISISTATLYNMLIALGVDQKYVIRFMNTPVVQDYINEMRKIASPTFNVQKSDVFKILAKKYVKGNDLPSQFYLPIWEKNKIPLEDDFKNNNAASKLRVLDFLQYILYVSNSYTKLSNGIKLIEDAPRSFGEYHAAKSTFKKLDNKSLSILINAGSNPMNRSEYMIPANQNMSITDNNYHNSLINTSLGRELIKSIIYDHSYYINNTGVEEFKVGDISKDIASAAEKAFRDYLSTHAVAANDNFNDVKREADKALHKIPEDNILRKYLNVNLETKAVSLRERYKRAKFYQDEVDSLQKAFSELPEKTKQLLIKNQVLQYGYNISQKLGGYAFIFDEDTHAEISQKITDLRSELEQVSNANKIIDYIKLTNPGVIADAKWIDSNSFDNLKLKSIGGVAAEFAYPKFVKKTSGKNIKIYRRVEKDGEVYYVNKMVVPETGADYNMEIQATNKIQLPFVAIKSSPKTTAEGSIVSKSKAGEENLLNTFYNQFEEVSDNYYSFNTATSEFDLIEPESGTRSKKIIANGIPMYIYAENTKRILLEPYTGYQIKEFNTIKEAEAFARNLNKEKLDRIIGHIRTRTEQQTQLSPKYKFSPSNDNEINYQLSSDQELMVADDPELDQFIKERLAKLFPKISLFENAEGFQEFLDKHYPGKKLNLEAFGAAIGMSNYINPNTAKQSTRIHETAHVYWDLLPQDLPVKKNMLQLYNGDEEALISDIGKVGVDLAKVSLKGGRLQRFLSMLKTFWSRVKEYIGIATKEDYVRIMADEVWSNKRKVGQKAKVSDTIELKYMTGTGSQKSYIESLIKAAGRFVFDEKEHKYNTIDNGLELTSVTQSFEADKAYSFDRDDMQEKADVSTDIGTKIHAFAEAIANGMESRKAADLSGLNIEDRILEKFANQLKEMNVKHSKEGHIVSEVVVGSADMKMAGTIDRLVVRENGIVDVYDFKTSEKSTNTSKYKSPMAYSKKSKFEKHGLQLALYGAILKSDDSYSGRPSVKVGKTSIIPIMYRMSENRITDIMIEPIIEHTASDYADFSKEADRIIEAVVEENTEKDREEIASAGIRDRAAYANDRQFPLLDYENELSELPDKKIATKQQNYRRKQINSIVAEFNKEYDQYVEDLQKMSKLAREVKWDELTLEEAKSYYDIISKYDSLATNLYMNKIYRVMAKRIAEKQMEITKVKKTSDADLTQAEVYFRALSEMSERFPELQNIDRKWRSAYENYGRRFEAMKQHSDKLYKEVQKEKMKSWSLTKKISYFLAPVKDHSVFTRNLWKGDKDVLKDYTDPTLTKAESDYVKYIIEQNSKFKDLHEKAGQKYQYGWLPQTHIGFFEQWNNAGLFKAMAEWKANHLPIEYIKIKFNNKDVTLGDAIQIVEEEAEGSIIAKARALKRIHDLSNQAKRQYKSGYHSDGKKISLSEGVPGYIMENGQWVERDGFQDAKFLFTNDKELKSRYQVRRANRGVMSKDVHKAFIEYQRDMIFVDQVNPILNDVLPIQALYQQNVKNPNVSKFLELFIHKNILQRGVIPVVGKNVDQLLYFGRMWTFFSVLAFNLPAAGFNLFIGKFQEFRRGGISELINGERLFWGNFKKSLAILRNYRLIDDTTELNPEKDAGFYFIRVATAGTWITEYMIQGAAFINQIQKNYPEVWDNFDSNGYLKDKSISLTGDQIANLRKKVKEVQGRYNEEDKRMYANYSMWSATMQFKTWLPDFVMDRLGNEYIDSYGEKHKGTYRSLISGLRDVYYWLSMNHDKIQSKKGTTDYENNMKNLREMLVLAVLFSAWAAAHGDDDDKKKGEVLMKMIGDVALIFNMNNMEFLSSQPMPTLGTFSRTINAFQSLAKGEIYERRGRYGEKGDYKFPGKFLRVMPFQHSLRPVFTNDKYEE